MSTLQTVRVWLEPHPEVPKCKQVRWEVVDVSLKDVLMGGVHPYLKGSTDYPAIRAMAERFNDSAFKVPELDQEGYCRDVNSLLVHEYRGPDKVAAFLTHIQEQALLVEDMTFLELVAIAKERMRALWSHGLAREMLQWAIGNLAEIRRFLKTKDASIRLSSYEDVQGLPLSRILSVDDFAGHDRLIIDKSLPTTIFRSASYVDSITDAQGRLKLAERNAYMSLEVYDRDNLDAGPLMLNVTVDEDGRAIARPDVVDIQCVRDVARVIAKTWRIDEGRMVFKTTVDKLEQMVEAGFARPSFPALQYGLKLKCPISRARIQGPSLQTYAIGSTLTQTCHADTLRSLLEHYGKAKSGPKDILVRKIAELAEERYQAQKADLDALFSEKRYVHLPKNDRNFELFPILEGEMDSMSRFILTLYATSHLRGNAILDPTHVNDTCSINESALALLTGKVSLEGVFLPIA